MKIALLKTISPPQMEKTIVVDLDEKKMHLLSNVVDIH